MNHVKYDPNLFDGHELRMFYTLAPTAFRILFGHSPRANAEELLSKAWNEWDGDPDDFYRDELLMCEEGALWHGEKRGQRMRRALHAGTIAKQLGFNRFAEVGAGIGTDGVALAKLGFDCAYLAELNQYSLQMMARCMDVAGVEFPIVNLAKHSKEEANQRYIDHGDDWLFSSDVFEHIHDLEGWLNGWITDFGLVIVYAPFGTSEKNASHTDYSKTEFNRFMARQGFDKVKVTGLGIPPMVYLRSEYNA